MNNISVGLGEIGISQDPDDVIVAYGLGSCLGIAMYDPVIHLGALLHAVLPENTNSADSNPAKYVDTGIVALIEQLKSKGAIQSRMITRVIGGANMLIAPGLSHTFDIGNRNVAQAHTVFSKLKIKVAVEETGGNIGRTVRLYIVDGRMTVRTMGGKERDL
jgi:chemotaxis protein CheD